MLLSIGFLVFLNRHHGTPQIALEEDIGPPARFASMVFRQSMLSRISTMAVNIKNINVKMLYQFTNNNNKRCEVLFSSQKIHSEQGSRLSPGCSGGFVNNQTVRLSTSIQDPK